MDFTLTTYQKLLKALSYQKYTFQTFLEFIENPLEHSVVLRHDIDLRPDFSLKVARLENEYGRKSSYYFRNINETFVPWMIKEIAEMDHEIGYHYENLAEVTNKNWRWAMGDGQEKNDIYKLAIKDFEENLKKFREIVDVKTICMHGSPTSKVDSRDLWKVYDYKNFGIIGEPYFDVDFSKVLYLTDTGRRWDGERYNIRDRVINNEMGTGNRRQGALRGRGGPSVRPDLETGNGGQGTSQNSDRPPDAGLPKPEPYSERPPVPGNPKPVLTHSYRTTFDIINALEKNELPDQIMINTHPQRWTNNPLMWTKELVWQNMKNQIKRLKKKW